MTYSGRVKGGVVIFEGAERPVDGTQVRVEIVTSQGETRDEVGAEFGKLAGAAQGLPPDLAERHDHYRRERRS